MKRVRMCFVRALIVVVSLLAARGAFAETTGRGDFEIFLDNAAFRALEGGAVEEVYLRVRNSGLRFKESRGKLESRLRMTLTLRDSTGKSVASKGEEIAFYEDNKEGAASRLRFHTVVRKYTLEPGVYDLDCRVEDLNAPKVSLIGFVKGSRNTAEVRGYPLIVPAFPPEAMSVSDAKFLWDVDASGPGPVYHPNPPRLYGLHRDSLLVYMESYVPPSLVGPRTLRFETEILDETGAVVKGATLDVPTQVAGAQAGLVTLPILIREDVNTLKAGYYTLYFNAGFSDQLMVRMRAGRFSVAWDLRTWEIPRRDYITEARFLLSDEDFGDFEKLSLGEQEKRLEEMWKKMDPDPSTGVNEAHQKFLARLEYVNARYSDYQTGIFSDRGLIYLKYGPPDEIEVDVVPENRESLSDAVQKVDDKFHPINYSNTGPRLRYARPGQNVVADPRRLGVVGEGGNVASPYELWSYNGGGDPILQRDKSLEPDIGLRFLFIDTEGYGRYRLESSSSMMNK